MKRNAFTLIELLVVVVIIGALAAVGVVAYNGYTSSAKKNAVKSMHAQTIKFIKAEILKCDMGETKVMNGNLNCSERLIADKIGAATQASFEGKFLNPFVPYNENVVAGQGHIKMEFVL